MPLMPGEPAPWFKAPTPTNPEFVFDTAAGRHVLLITVGGKRIEGFLASADDHHLQLRIERGGGSALIAIDRSGISQVQLLHW